MNPRYLAAALLVIPVILASGCTTEQPIGGETDEHGCMLMAGYTWCDARQKCLRTWEEPCPESLSPTECEEMGGRSLNIVGGQDCDPGEMNISMVVGFISPNICCVPFPESKRLTLEQAMEAAEVSGCMEMGSLTDSYVYNPNSHTWWIDMDMKPEFAKDYCSPACVVSEETGEAGINWRCTGALPPE